MKVDFFANEYKNNSHKEGLLNKVMNIKKYVPYEEKISDCNKIMNSTSWVTKNGITEFQVNTANRWCLFVMTFLMKYTTLDFNTENLLSDYNVLSSCGALDDMMAFISNDKWLQREYAEYQTVFNMRAADYDAYNTSSLNYWRRLVENINKEISKYLPEIMNQYNKAK